MNHNNLKLFSKNNYKNYNIYAITKKLKVFIILFFYNIFLSTYDGNKKLDSRRYVKIYKSKKSFFI